MFVESINTNSIGYREREPSNPKDSLEKRTLLIGDSFVVGVGAPQDSI